MTASRQAIRRSPQGNADRKTAAASVERSPERGGRGAQPAPPVAPGFTFATMPVFPTPAPQRFNGLRVSRPDDALETEAHRVAEHVMHMHSSEERALAPAASDRAPHDGGSAQPAWRHAPVGTSGPGTALDPGTRDFFEGRFGFDFGAVRVHSDSESARSATALRADAYTIGRDIVFAEGRYEPSTQSGRALLAHELVHVVQGSNHPASQLSISRADSSVHAFRHTKAECDEQYQECGDTCRALPPNAKKRRALCWAACMATYAACLASSEEALATVTIIALLIAAALAAEIVLPVAAAAALLAAVRNGNPPPPLEASADTTPDDTAVA